MSNIFDRVVYTNNDKRMYDTIQRTYPYAQSARDAISNAVVYTDLSGTLQFSTSSNPTDVLTFPSNLGVINLNSTKDCGYF